MPGRIYVGTSGFAYKEWRPSFYPDKLAEKRFLGYYAGQLPAVEIDGTFYRMPKAEAIARWVAETPRAFKFAVKASQKITHFERLKLPSDATEYFTRTVAGLGERLGTVLFQLPPNMKRNDERLGNFLGALPPDLPCTFEFRNAGWFDPAVYALLREHRVSLCINEGDETTTPHEVTGPLVYLRLRKTAYDDAALDAWAARMRAWASEGKDVLAFIKHEDNPACAQVAGALWSRLRDG